MYFRKYKITLLIILTALVSGACSSFQRMDDAVRIKPEESKKYIKHPKSGDLRNGQTLRGTVIKVQVTSLPDSCPITPETEYTSKASVVFLDENVPAIKENYEYIPMEVVEQVKDFTDVAENRYGSINVFENYNDPEKVKRLREVPVDSIVVDTCCPCKCVPFRMDMSMDMKLALDLNCVERDFKWYFAEIRGAYAMYNDMLSNNETLGRDGYPFELAAGFRLGGLKEWGIGLAYSSGIKSYNSFKGAEYLRPVVMLHGRYQSPKDRFLGLCMRPFGYMQFGLTIDELSVSLLDFNLNTECKDCRKHIKDLEAQNVIPDLDFSMPLSFGIGFGFDIPVVPDVDLSFDVGFRSIGFGESVQAAGFGNVPSLRRINMMIFRFGLTI